MRKLCHCIIECHMALALVWNYHNLSDKIYNSIINYTYHAAMCIVLYNIINRGKVYIDI